MKSQGNSDEMRAGPTFEGFTIEQWASFAKKKSSIASGVCKLNGELKARINKRQCSASRNPIVDPRMCRDPWSCSSTSKTPQTTQATKFDAWSGYHCTLGPASADTDATPPKDEEPKLDDVNPESDAPQVVLNISGQSSQDAPAIDLHVLPDCDAAESAGSSNIVEMTSNHDIDHGADESTVECDMADAPQLGCNLVSMEREFADALRQASADSTDATMKSCEEDLPIKSWDKPAIIRQWNRIRNENAADRVGDWLKDRYKHKHGSLTKNMDLAIGSLTNKEAQALLAYCRSLDPALLEIPFYIHLQREESYSEADVADVQLNVARPKAKGSSEAVSKFNMAPLSKRGMAQSRTKKKL